MEDFLSLHGIVDLCILLVLDYHVFARLHLVIELFVSISVSFLSVGKIFAVIILLLFSRDVVDAFLSLHVSHGLVALIVRLMAHLSFPLSDRLFGF